MLLPNSSVNTKRVKSEHFLATPKATPLERLVEASPLAQKQREQRRLVDLLTCSIALTREPSKVIPAEFDEIWHISRVFDADSNDINLIGCSCEHLLKTFNIMNTYISFLKSYVRHVSVEQR
ncbi:hypothetical protein L596_002467 [Steinernema carpocapsae]|uniref:Uncharacterized protein n=1 Tax=Steinernema carpocapsae TaxID=34508 RepID=A0A4U8US48_STECR|nr:hypothetical protein L596_002467 [Steinernema carpocapsae]